MDTANEDSTFVGAGLSVALRSGIYVDAAVTLAERDVEDRWGVGVRVAF
jgi:hypothetical protein